jgi:hypothetical protein
MKILRYFLIILLFLIGCKKNVVPIEVIGVVVDKEFNDDSISGNSYMLLQVKDPRHSKDYRLKIYCVSSHDDVLKEGDMISLLIATGTMDEDNLVSYISWEKFSSSLKVIDKRIEK